MEAKKYDETSFEFEYRPVTELFEEQVRMHPEKMAVAASGECLSYEELNRRANKVAHSLIALGVKAESIVGVLLDRKSHVYAARQGILKSGGAFTSMAPDYPDDRIRYILEDSGAEILITTEEIKAQHEDLWGSLSCRVLLIEDLLKSEKEDNPNLAIGEHDLCYCIYTSGSTGKPKGVMIEHGNLANFVNPNEKNYETIGITQRAHVCLALAAITFDVSIMEEFIPLTSGLSVVLANEEEILNPLLLSELICKYGVDCMITTPSFLSGLLDLPQMMEALKQIAVYDLGAEAFPGGLYNKIVAVRPDAYIMNGYGPTETTISCTMKVIFGSENITIGIPNANVQVHIINEKNEEVPDGEVGEMLICGKGVGRGYINLPEKTKETFIDFGGQRAYKSGDLARWNGKGEIEFHGRSDNQIKLRGLRIELGEIEEVINQFPGVKTSVVIPVDDAYLCGYFTADREIDVDELLKYASGYLTYYMVPDVLIQLEEMPLTSNMKIDKKALPKPVFEQKEIEMPKTQMQQRIHEIVSSVTGNSNFGINTNLYRAGLTSLGAMKLNLLLAEEFDIAAKTSDIHENNTIVLLEQFIKNAPRKSVHEERESYPLTGSQKGIFVECSKNPGSTIYNIPFLFALDEKIDVERLREAVGKVVSAHSYLLTRIGMDKSGELYQKPGKEDFLPECIRMTDAEFAQKKAELVKPFEIQEERLFRMEIYVTESKKYLFVDFHHIVADGNSYDIFFEDLNEVYQGKEIGAETYTGFDAALDEEQEIESSRYKKAALYYDGIFAGLETESLPIADKKEPIPTKGMTSRKMTVPKEKILAYCEKMQVTPNTLFTGLFGVVMARYANAQDALFATIYNGRNDSRLENTICMLVKTLPVYCSFDPKMPVNAYMMAVQKQLMDSMANDIFPFSDIAAKYGITSDLIFAYQAELTDDYPLGDTIAVGEDLSLDMPKEPLLVQVRDYEGSYVLTAEYRADMYETVSIDGILEAYDAAMDSMLKSRYISEISILSDDQRKILDQFNEVEVPFDRSKTVVDLFREAAFTYPDHTAVVYRDKRISYKELDEITDRVGGYLAGKGLGAEDPVAILISRSEYMAVASLGVLKAGCAYQPLDPTYPKDRLKFMLEDSGARFLIADASMLELVPDFGGEILLTEKIGELPKANGELPKAKPEDMFVLLYTSGSTGVPKGCMLEYGNITAYCRWYHRYYQLNQDCRVAAYASFGFDASMMDIFCTLTAGAQLHIIEEDIRLDFTELNRYFEENGITNSFMTTQVGRQFAMSMENKSLKHLSVGGEKLVPLEPPKDYKFYNIYGPTECTVAVTALWVDKFYDNIPIGKPMDNLKLYIADQQGHRLPVGACGELLISGLQVARGYLNRPEKTKEVFIANPYTQEADYRRMYRTGDIVRFLPDGMIQFVGRKDAQVKIRGFRIELTEVEEIIRRFPGIKDATVAAFDETGGGKYIAAYVVSDETVDIEALNGFILETKPPYMVPAVTMQIDEIPLNQNQKVNKRALPEPVFEQKEIELPKTQMQQRIFEIVSSVTGNSNFGINTDLYKAGLTSLVAMKLNLLLAEEFGITAKSSDIHENNTVALLEQFIKKAPRNVVHEERESYPLTGSQKGIFVECSKNPDSTIYNIPFLFTLDAKIDVEKLKEAVGKVVCAHTYLSTRIGVDESGELYQKPGKEDFLPECIRMTDAEFAQKKAELVRPFKIQEERLFRMEIYETESKNYLFIDLHHIIADGSSCDIFFKDLNDAYQGKGVKAETYTGFDAALDEEQEIENGRYKKAALYYDGIFAGLETESLPIADKKEPVPAKGMTSRKMTVPKEKILACCEKMQVTPNTLFTGLFGVVMARYANAQDALFATIYNGRNDSRLEKTICMLVKTLPVYCSFDKNMAVNDYMMSVQKQLMDSMANDIFPFSDIAAKYGITSDLIFAYQAELSDDYPLGDTIAVGEDLSLDMPKEPLLIQVMNYEGSYVLTAEYRADLYEAVSIDGILEAYDAAMDSMIKSRYVSEISILSDDQKKVLDRFNETEVPFDRSKTVVDMFREAAFAYPDHTAVVYRDVRISYKELDELTDRIGGYLAGKGLGAEDPVAILIPRCEYMAVASLGVLKAGCAYQPLDPTYPKERLQFMLEDSGARLLIADASMLELVPDFKGEILLTKKIKELPKTDIRLPKAKPEDMFVLLYTSGSTGVPKGCMLEYGNITAYCRWYHRYYQLNQDCRMAAYASFGFDASMMDIFCTLTAGAQLHIIGEDIRLDFMELNRYFEENGITNSFMTTQVGRQFAMSMENKSLKHLSVGGEKLVPLEPPKDYKFYNIYGPTECTVAVTTLWVDKFYDNIPIGKSLDNLKLYIVDQQGHRLPVGACGELLISGLQVSRGYLNRPEKTEEVFITNPYTQEADYQRMYRTGDIVRFLPDGMIQFVGRKDAQVKIRGFRIELTEVEEIIRRFPGIKDATVAAFDEKGGGKYIAAYVVSDQPVDTEALGRFILETKPPYMVPAVTMQIDAIPLNQNQKVNKRALPKPEKKQEELVAPETEIQKRIFECVAEAVGHREFGITTDIYFAGLTSISAIRLNVLLAKEFDIVIKTADLKKNATILQLEKFVLGSTAAGKHEVQEVYPLTNTQMGVFIDCTANMGTTVYNIPYLLKLGDKVDIDRLKSAAEQVIDAHPYLKVQLFMDEDGEIRQRRNDTLPSKVEIINGMDQTKLVRPYGLFGEPLCRFEIYRTMEGNYLFMDLHHLIADGTSLEILIEQINLAYSGEKIQAEVYTSYDAALDHEAAVNSEAYKAAEAFYLAEFGECGGDTSFYPDKKDEKPAVGNTRFIDKDLNPEQVKTVCEKYGITENVFFIGAFGMLLGKYHFKEEAVFTTIYHGRNDSRLAETVGMLVKTLPVRCRMEEDLGSYFGTLRDQLMNAMDHDIYPFSEISRRCHIQPDAMLVYQGDNFVFDTIGEEKAEEIPLALNAAKEPVSLSISLEEGRFVYDLEYRKDLFEPESIDFILENFSKVTRGLAKEKNAGQIQLLFEEEKEMVNDPAYTGKTFVDLFKRAAALYPDRGAVRDENGTITYEELDRLSDYVAAKLTENGFGPEKVAGILSGRTREFVIGYVGVMKAGGAYVPLDPEYPQERLEYMLSDSGADNLLAVREYAGLMDFYKGNVLWLDDMVKEGENYRLTAELTPPIPENLAYMIYTSGSTGKPKGVMIEQRNLVNLIMYMVSALKMIPEDICSEFASFCFDASVHDLFAPLAVGALLYIFPESIRKDALKVAETIKKEKITMVTFPTQMGELVAEVLTEPCALRYMTLGGEKFKRYYNRSYTMINGYGPTENTVSSTEFVVDKDYKNIPIGRSQMNVRSYILDEKQNRLPVGAPGELCHAGRQIARGYHNLPEKTAASFVENPFKTCADDARMYHTGDMVRMKGDGNIEYIGRIDSQVKIRGYRVELSEIEGAVLSYEGIREAAVNVVEKSGNKYIVAYYTGASPDVQIWQEFLKPLLPEYMLPAFYMHLDSMPVTPGGKIDKRALPAPDMGTEREGYEPPVNAAQAQLCEIFEKALGMDRVGIDDNFFELGGTSLTASKIAVLCLAKKIPLVYADIFKYPTVRQLSAWVNQDSVEETEEKDEISSYPYEKINRILFPNRAKNADLVKKEELGDILLTGATGFLGIHVLKAFLDSGQGNVYALVRKGKYPSCEKRLMNMLMYYFDDPHTELFGKRIFCIDGDITDQKSLEGLKEYPFRTLINCAACVKHFSSDDTLQRINVDGVRNLIALCSELDRRLIQISTVSVAGEGMGDKPGMDRDLCEHELYIGQRITNEYIRTKFLAERYLLEAVQNGLDAKIIRVGNLMSRNSDGEFQINFVTNGFLRGVRGYVAVGMFPISGMNESAEFSPIDSTAEAILKLAGTDKNFTVYHACNSHHIFMGDLIYAMRNHGFEIQIVSDETFQQAVNDYAASHEDSEAVSGLIAYASRDEDQVYTVGYKNQFTTEVLYRLDYKWPITDDKYLENAIDALDKLGFFE